MTSTSTKEEALRWGFFHDLFREPKQEQWDWLQTESVQKAWAILSDEFGADISSKIPMPDTYEQFHEDYIAAFEVGAPSPPCPLIESHWNKRDSTPRILHENMLFYRQFGLELRSSANETADHLRHQLEFLNHLCVLSIRYDDESLINQISTAKRDFIERHLISWIPRAAESFKNECPDWWASEWMMLLRAYITTISTN